MKSPLHILHLEDDPNDAALVQSTLEAEGITCAITCVENRDEFVAALERGGIDLILSDYTLPAFDGMSALKIAQVKWPAIPLIFVSGTLGEERAIDSLKNGATDYVLKERLARLVPAVHRAMQEVKERVGRQQAEAKRREYSAQDSGAFPPAGRSAGDRTPAPRARTPRRNRPGPHGRTNAPASAVAVARRRRPGSALERKPHGGRARAGTSG